PDEDDPPPRRTRGREGARERQVARRAARVVVGAVVDLARAARHEVERSLAALAEVVVVGADDEHLVREVAPLARGERRDDVPHLAAARLEVLEVGAVVARRLQADLLALLGDPLAGLLAALGARFAA